MGIPPGTPFEDLPEDFECPICSVGKQDFSPILGYPSTADGPNNLQATIQAVMQRTPTIKTIRLSCPGLKPFLPGQYVLLTLNGDPQLTKPLSISNSPAEAGVIEITKRITGSAFSKAFNQLRAGQQVSMSAPQGDFVLDTALPRVGFICGGIGIAPLFSMSKYIVDAGVKSDVCMLYCNRSEEEIAFRSELDELARRGISTVHTLTRAGAAWNGRRGRIDAALVRSEIPDYLQRVFYLCGPATMVDAMAAMLHQELGVPKEQVKFEYFSGY